MSFNDRAGEAAAILDHGGVIPRWGPFREALIELLESTRDCGSGASYDMVYAILEHPANADLRAQTSDGEWVGGPDD